MSRISSVPALILMFCWLSGAFTPVLVASGADAPTGNPADPSQPSGLWHTDYADAMDAAARESRMLLVFFYDPAEKQLSERFESQTLADPCLRTRLPQVVKTRLPVDATIRVDGEEVALLEHPAFSRLSGRPGVVIIDFFHQDAKRHGRVVATVPFKKGCIWTVRDLAVLLELPTGETARRPDAPRPRPVEETPRPQPRAREGRELSWHDDYAEATQVAEREGKMLLIYFPTPKPNESHDRFERETLADPEIAEKLEDVVRARLPVDTEIRLEDRTVELLEQPAFTEMLGSPGLAILDFVDEDSPQHGCVVSTFPFLDNRPFTTEQMAVILDLPPGTLTQRTLIFAVRTHPDRPASTEGDLNPDLIEAAESHSQHQAALRLQGHHQWESRYHRINRKLPRGLRATEVCAESWPGEGLLEAAVECVRCWRLSSGHWRAVRGRHRFYGYDMKRGSNGVWYATGIFGGK